MGKSIVSLCRRTCLSVLAVQDCADTVVIGQLWVHLVGKKLLCLGRCGKAATGEHHIITVPVAEASRKTSAVKQAVS